MVGTGQGRETMDGTFHRQSQSSVPTQNQCFIPDGLRGTQELTLQNSCSSDW